jgi:hypothetical protein
MVGLGLLLLWQRDISGDPNGVRNRCECVKSVQTAHQGRVFPPRVYHGLVVARSVACVDGGSDALHHPEHQEFARLDAGGQISMDIC